MASRNRNSNKPELVAIYRLEFYKNKKNWKIANEKQQNPPKPGIKTKKNGRNNTLNETYNVEPGPDSETGKTSLNNAFMHEIPTDKSTECAEPSPPQVTPKTLDQPHSDQIAAPGPELHHKGLHNNPEPRPKTNSETEHHQNIWDDGRPVDKHTSYKIQDHPTWMNTDNQYSNQEQPNNLQWLLKTSVNTCHNQPTPRLPQPNTWHNQNTWFKQPINQPLENTWKGLQKPQEYTIKDQVSWKNTKDQYGPQTVQWENSVNTQYNLQNIENTKKEDSFILPDTTVPPPPFRTQNAWPNPKLQENWVNPNPGNTSNGLPTLPNPGDILLAGLKPSFEPGRQSSGDQEFGQDCNPGYFCPEKGQDVWNNEPLGQNIEVLAQNMWINQAWQEKEMWLNGDKEWCGPEAEDAPDGLYEEGGLYTEPHTTQVDQCTLKPQSTLECETPEQIRRQTDCWLRRLMTLNRLNDEWYECESVCDQYQRGYNESSDFVREAHDVAHSSKNDPNDTLEWVWSLTSPASLPGLSPRRLAAATHHVSNTLRSLLQEQLIRDQLRGNRTSDVEEFPTRDREVFPGEFVLSGSHLPRSTRQLAPAGPGGSGGAAPPARIIKIDMLPMSILMILDDPGLTDCNNQIITTSVIFDWCNVA